MKTAGEIWYWQNKTQFCVLSLSADNISLPPTFQYKQPNYKIPFIIADFKLFLQFVGRPFELFIIEIFTVTF